jgi:hypothetical protein
LLEWQPQSNSLEGRIHFAGDSAYGTHFRTIYEKYGCDPEIHVESICGRSRRITRQGIFMGLPSQNRCREHPSVFGFGEDRGPQKRHDKNERAWWFGVLLSVASYLTLATSFPHTIARTPDGCRCPF